MNIVFFTAICLFLISVQYRYDITRCFKKLISTIPSQ